MNRPPEKNAPARLQPDTERELELINRRNHSAKRAGRKRALPRSLRDTLAKPPAHGEGVHGWLFTTALRLHDYRRPGEICELLAEAVAGCGRPVPATEISDAVENSVPGTRRLRRRRAAANRGPAGSKTAKWPDRDQAEIARIVAADPGAMAKLDADSPWQVRCPPLDAAPLLALLFPGNPWLCRGMITPKFAHTERRCAPDARLNGAALIVPSPMTGPTGRTKKGKESRRCDDNTGPRWYLVTEFDEDDRDTQAAIIRYLSQFAPLTMVVDSAGKSLHAWWRCRGQAEENVLKFFRLAVRLGADRATWSRCQMVRMPLGLRDAVWRQEVRFFDPRNTVAMERGAR